MNLELLVPNIILDLFLIIIPLSFIHFIEKKKITKEELGFREEKIKKEIILTGKIFFSLLIISLFLSISFSFFEMNDLAKVESVVRELVIQSPLFLAYFFIFRVFAEEIFFRAFLVPRVGVVGSSVVFGLAHFGYGSLLEVIGATTLGFVLAIYYRKNKLIMPNFVAHLIYNFVSVMLLVVI